MREQYPEIPDDVFRAAATLSPYTEGDTNEALNPGNPKVLDRLMELIKG